MAASKGGGHLTLAGNDSDAAAAGGVDRLHDHRLPHAPGLPLRRRRVVGRREPGTVEAVVQEALAEKVLLRQGKDTRVGVRRQPQRVRRVGRCRRRRVGSVGDNAVGVQRPGQAEDRVAVGRADVVILVGEAVAGVAGQVVAGDDVVPQRPGVPDRRHLEG